MLYDQYQTQVNVEYNKGSELKKELFVFDSDKKRISDNLKINKFIYYLNQNFKDNNIQYNNISFPIHYIDLQDFITYLDNNDFKNNYIIDIKTMCESVLKPSSIDNAVYTGLESIIKNKEIKKIYSYLKILNFEAQGANNLEVSYNERYKININNNVFNLKHIRDKSAFYVVTNNNIQENKEYLNNHAEINNNKIKNPRNLIYDDKLVLGPFDMIFNEKTNTATIANSMENLVNKVVEGKKVFIMGYGVTGSGKTSTLIHYDNKPGVIMEMCNMVGQKMISTSSNVCYATVSYVEYFKELQSKPIELSNALKQTYFVLSGNEQHFNLNSNIQFETEHPYRSGISKSFNAGTSMGEVLKFIIDDDRLVKATPNNPNSSRSHVICIIRFFDDKTQVQESIKNYSDYLKNLKPGEDGKIKYPRCLIVGDLAGVENKFTCNNYYTLKNFFNVKKENSTEPFYKNNFYEGKFDPIYNTPMQNGGNETYENYFNNSNNYFVFNQTTVESLFSMESIIEPKRYQFYLKYILELIDIKTESINSDMVTKGNYILEQLNKLENIMQSEKEKLSQLIETENKATNKTDIYKYQWTLDKNGPWYKLIQVLIGFGKANSLSSTYLPGEYLNTHGLDANANPNPETDKRINNPDTTYKDAYAKYKKQAIELLDYNNVVQMVATIKECIEINKYMKTICENRVNEGEYINQSLKDLTSDIHKILLYENQNSYYMPQYANECFKQYYPFNVPELSDPDVRFSSDIMKYIYKNTFANEVIDASVEGPISPNFFSNIEICIFGVFNSSRTFNNPPPIQYININTLKRHLYRFEYEQFKTELSKLIQITDINYDENKSIKKSVRYSIKTVSPYSWNVLKAVSDFVNGTDQNKKPRPLTFDVFNHIVKLLTLIENRNRLTQIGTVEFLDKIAKLNSIQASCEEIPETKSDVKPAVFKQGQSKKI
jgi:hypothetical protein